MLRTISEMVGLYRATRATAELELRLGTLSDDGHFSPGVPRDIFEHLEEGMAGTLKGDREWSEIVDYHYTLARGERARTRVAFDTNKIEMTREHVAKRSSRTFNLRCAGDTSSGETCRIALSVEEPIPTPPDACMPNFVRIKQRRCFLDIRDDGNEVWSYELSKSWSGASRMVVEHLQHTTEPTYEVECELRDSTGAYLLARSDEDVARSLVVKAGVLLGQDRAEVEAA